MSQHKVRLLKSEEVAEQTYAFYFQKPAEFEYRAGQTIDLTLINPQFTDEKGPMHTYSLTTSPHEETIAIATRMRDSAFKRSLAALSPGDEVGIEGPLGSFTLHKNATRPAVFLVGGIGITPFRSIILDAHHNKLPHKIFLFYSNRRPEDAAFLDEFKSLSETSSQFVFVPTMTNMEQSRREWKGERGYITAKILEKHAPGLTQAMYYSAGPHMMVSSMRQLLLGKGIDEDDIRTEEFSGY